jgi:hypothetical protein
MEDMKNLANKNPNAYTGDEIIERSECFRYPGTASKVMSLIDIEERAGGGLILCLEHDGKLYDFEFERAHKEEGRIISKGESVRRHFLNDIGALDIFDDWDPHTLDYDNLIGKTIEAFVSKGINNSKGNKKDKIVAVSPVFIPVQIKSGESLDIEMGLEGVIYTRREEGLNDYSSEGNLN